MKNFTISMIVYFLILSFTTWLLSILTSGLIQGFIPVRLLIAGILAYKCPINRVFTIFKK